MTPQFLDLTIDQVLPGDLLGEEGRVARVVIDESWLSSDPELGPMTSDLESQATTLHVGPCWKRGAEFVPSRVFVDGEALETGSVQMITMTEPVWGELHTVTAWEGTKRIVRGAPLPPLPSADISSADASHRI